MAIRVATEYDAETLRLIITLQWVIFLTKDPDQAYEGTRILYRRLREIGKIWE